MSSTLTGMPSTRELYLTPTKNCHYKWRHGQYCFIINKGKSGSKSLQRVLRLWKSSHKTLSNHPNPLFQCGWLKNLSSTSLVCQILASKFTAHCTSENQSNRQCNDRRQETYWRQNQILFRAYYTAEFRRILMTFTKFQFVLPGTVWKKRL